MSEIKPVAVTSSEFGKVVWRMLPVFAQETPMYIIPDTHRIVSVAMLERLMQETLYYASRLELHAIIDNKEQS